MKYRVGPYVYALVVSDRRIYGEDGEELEGACIPDRRLLIISPIVEKERRPEVALHELVHAFSKHFPSPATEEERANFSALVAQSFRRDTDDQGGMTAFDELPPTRVPEIGQPTPAVQPMAVKETFGKPDRVICGCCGAETMCGDVHNGEPVVHEATRKVRVERWYTCEACGRLMTWWEICTPDGEPIGEYVSNPRPRVLSGADAAAFLAAHPTAALV